MASGNYCPGSSCFFGVDCLGEYPTFGVHAIGPHRAGFASSLSLFS